MDIYYYFFLLFFSWDILIDHDTQPDTYRNTKVIWPSWTISYFLGECDSMFWILSSYLSEYLKVEYVVGLTSNQWWEATVKWRQLMRCGDPWRDQPKRKRRWFKRTSSFDYDEWTIILVYCSFIEFSVIDHQKGSCCIYGTFKLGYILDEKDHISVILKLAKANTQNNSLLSFT